MVIWRSFWRGCGRAAALWPVVLLLYAVDTAFALTLAIPPANQLAALFGHSSMAPDLLGPVSLDWLTDALGTAEPDILPGPLYLVMPLLFLVVGTFLRGGTIGALVSAARPFRWADFFSDCARFFGRFLLLLIFVAPVLLVVALVSAFVEINLLLDSDPGDLLGTVLRGAVLPFLLFLLLTALDYVRISLVLAPERRLWRHLGRGFWFLLRRSPQAVPLGLAFALAAALLGALYPALLQLPTVAGSIFLAPLLQQLTLLLLNWQRVASLGGEVTLYQEVAFSRPRQPVPSPALSPETDRPS